MGSATLPRNGLSPQYDHIIGIDSHRDFHVAVALDRNGGRLGLALLVEGSSGCPALGRYPPRSVGEVGSSACGHQP